MTILEWMDWAAGQLGRAGLHFGHGTDNARDEAAWIVLHAARQPLDGSFTDWGREVNDRESEEIRRLVAARIDEKVPLAYLTGRARFAGLDFLVSDAALVPRSPIAELIEEDFAPWVDGKALRRVLDLCTGCGCIAVAIAAHMPWVEVDAVDLSADALDLARANTELHAVEDRVNLIASDLFQSLPGCQYDLIVANPPYVPAEDVGGLPAEYQAEPAMGLASGADGLDAALEILAGAAQYMAETGLLICEVGESEGRLAALLPGLPFLWLEFARGGSGVFVLTRRQLEASRPMIDAVLEERKYVT